MKGKWASLDFLNELPPDAINHIRNLYALSSTTSPYICTSANSKVAEFLLEV